MPAEGHLANHLQGFTPTRSLPDPEKMFIPKDLFPNCPLGENPRAEGKADCQSRGSSSSSPSSQPQPLGITFLCKGKLWAAAGWEHQGQGKASTKNISKVGEAIWCIAVDKAVQWGLHEQQEQLLSGKRGNLKRNTFLMLRACMDVLFQIF